MNDSLDLDAISVTSSPFGVTKSGEEVTYFELKNRNGVTVGVINYGLAITKILVPDKNGMLGDVVLGHDTIKGYEDENDYFGCIVGRFGNRIGEGKFQLNGQVHEIGKNNNGHSLHGGFEGFDKKVWKAEILEHADESGVIFSYRSEDGEEGYPGNMDAKVIYTLNELNEIKLYYEAVTDKKTVVNLTNHAYFNLRDAGVTDILDHELEIRASRFTPVNDEMITTGEIFSLENSPLDFRQATKIGTRLMEDETQLKNGLGYDHNYVLDKEEEKMELAARVFEPESCRTLEVLTTEPGIQFYSGNFLKGSITGKYGTVYQRHAAFCLETQHFPNSPNHPHFPTVVLNPDDTLRSTTVYKFGVES